MNGLDPSIVVELANISLITDGEVTSRGVDRVLLAVETGSIEVLELVRELRGLGVSAAGSLIGSILRTCEGVCSCEDTFSRFGVAALPVPGSSRVGFPIDGLPDGLEATSSRRIAGSRLS